MLLKPKERTREVERKENAREDCFRFGWIPISMCMYHEKYFCLHAVCVCSQRQECSLSLDYKTKSVDFLQRKSARKCRKETRNTLCNRTQFDKQTIGKIITKDRIRMEMQ